jgi:hypothetical protein
MVLSQLCQALMATQSHFPSVSIDISHLYNNIAVGPHATFDLVHHHSWAPELLPTKSITVDGIDVGSISLGFV